MSRLKFALLLTLIVPQLFAQTTFTGVITDSLNNPVPFASIYLNNTTYGASSDNSGTYSLRIDQEGVYELIVSCIGFNPKSYKIQADNKQHVLNITLSVKPVDLKEVIVEEKSTNRITNYTHFLSLFLGPTKFARFCTIRNLNDLRLYGKIFGSINRGYSVKPLEIENRALGYHIIYDLRDFSYDYETHTIKFYGQQYFIPMKGSKRQVARWEENRKVAYYGSSLHFFRKLFSDSAFSNGYAFYQCSEEKSEGADCKPVAILGESQLVTQATSEYKQIFYYRDVKVVYSRLSGEKKKGRLNIKSTLENSLLRFSDTISLYKNGFYYHPYNVLLGGRLGDARIAEMLPYDFMPEDYDYSTETNTKNLLQDSINKYIVTPYNNYFSGIREQVYTHFNKSAYFPGDEIWFKNYIIEKTTGYPSDSSRILYTELYDPNGKLIGEKILYITNATASNSFKLNENSLPGRYTFRVYTQWMKNFQRPEEFNTYLDVLGETHEKEPDPETDFDIQLLPESGTLLAGIWNRVGVKALDQNGKGISLKGEILNSQKKVKTTFELNQFGMGEFRIFPRTDSLYVARIFLPDGNVHQINLPPAQEKGIIVNANTGMKGKTAVAISSNQISITDRELFHVLIHNRSDISSTATIELTKDKPYLSFLLSDDDVSNGVNYITVFNRNFEPVAEKAFFRIKKNVLGKFQIEQRVVNDSVEFKVTSSDSLNSPVQANLSMSVLPDGTVSDKFITSLYYESLLKPGLSGNIENPSYYFESNDKQHLLDLDLLFLTQGWLKYEWKAILSDTTKIRNPFERAFSVEGKVEGKSDSPKNYVVSLLSPDSNLFLIKNVDSNGQFVFPNLYIRDKTVINLTASESTGKTRNIAITARLLPEYTPDSLIEVNPGFKTFTQNNPAETELKLLPKEILLKDVVVTAKAQKNSFEGAAYKPVFEKVVEITKENFMKYASIEQLLRNEFNVGTSHERGEYKIDLNTSRSSGNPNLIIDDINYRDNYNYLDFMNMSIVEAVSVIKTGNAMVGEGGAIIIKTRKEAIDWGYPLPDNVKNIKALAFAQPAKYYTPRYLYPPDSESFKKYATIYWKPDIITNGEGKATFRFPVPSGVKGIKVRTEGFSESGIVFLDNSLIEF